MAISCDPHDLAVAARCYCFDNALSDAVAIYLLCAWANEGQDPAKQGYLIQDEADGGGFILLNDGGRIIVQTI